IPYMIVSTVYPGVAPSDIENLITRPIEQELKSLKDVREITSSSSESFSVIAIEFEPTVDLDFALQKVKDRVDAAKPEIPADAEDPVVTEINVENMPMMNVIITADYDLVKLKSIAEDFADEFETISGVLEAEVTGQLEREVQINVDPNRLKDYNLPFNDVTMAIMNEHLTIPGGTMDIGDMTYSVRVPGELRDPDGFRDLVVTATEYGPVYIRDLAEVQYGFKEQETLSRYDGKSCVTIGIKKRTGENIIAISDQVKQIIEDKKPTLPSGTYFAIGQDMSKFIKIMVAELENNIINGFVLVMLCIFLFLGITNAFFVATCIPLSMLITFIVLNILGITLNMIVLFSLILSLGMLVDNAIVIVENIYRHRSKRGNNVAKATEEAANEVEMAIAASTLTTICAFAPIMFWPGILGEFMSYLPLTVIITLLASLFVAVVVNPVLCFLFMKVKPGSDDRFTSGGGFFGRVLKYYGWLLDKAVHKPKTTLLLSFFVLILSFVSYGVLGHGITLFGESDPDAMFINIKAPLGTRIEATDAIVRQLEKTAAEFPDVINLTSTVGVSSSGSGMTGMLTSGGSVSNEARIYMDFLDFEDRSQRSLKTVNESVNKIKYITGADVEVAYEDMGPPVGAPVEIRVSGEDYLLLGELARDIREIIKPIQGLVDLKDDFVSSKPEVVFRVDREKAKIMDVSTFDIASTVRTAINGFDAGDFRDGEDEYEITVRFAEKDRNSLPDLDNIYVFTEGKQIPISSLGHFENAAGFGTITRIDLDRVVTITGNNHNRLSSEILSEVREMLADHELPPGYLIKFSGENQDSEEASAFLKKAFLIALFLIAMVLVSQFDSVTIPFIIMTSVVLSLIGVLWGLIISGLPFSIVMTGVGVISLAGVVVNNAIVLLDYTLKLRERGRSKIDAIIEAGKTRFRPVILTAITTIVGIIPLATGWSFNIHTFRFATSGASSQWWAPMAVAIIYGLAVATILTLIVVPSMYMLLGRKEHDKYFEEHKLS
ncbi:efflux RND transporter permease subunit, partial [Candidatus Latescibacterota bacterium]